MVKVPLNDFLMNEFYRAGYEWSWPPGVRHAYPTISLVIWSQPAGSGAIYMYLSLGIVNQTHQALSMRCWPCWKKMGLRWQVAFRWCWFRMPNIASMTARSCIMGSPWRLRNQSFCSPEIFSICMDLNFTRITRVVWLNCLINWNGHDDASPKFWLLFLVNPCIPTLWLPNIFSFKGGHRVLDFTSVIVRIYPNVILWHSCPGTIIERSLGCRSYRYWRRSFADPVQSGHKVVFVF